MSVDIPSEVVLFLNLLGFPYPDIDADQVREFSRYVTEFAADVQETHAAATKTIHDMGNAYSGESYEALLAAWAGMGTGNMEKLNDACDLVSTTLDTAADVIEAMQIAVLTEIAALAAVYIGMLFTPGGIATSQLIALAGRKLLQSLTETLLWYIAAEVVSKAIEPFEQRLEEMMNEFLYDKARDVLGVPPGGPSAPQDPTAPGESNTPAGGPQGPSGNPEGPPRKPGVLYIDPDQVRYYASQVETHADTMRNHADTFTEKTSGLTFTTPGLEMALGGGELEPFHLPAGYRPVPLEPAAFPPVEPPAPTTPGQQPPAPVGPNTSTPDGLGSRPPETPSDSRTSTTSDETSDPRLTAATPTTADASAPSTSVPGTTPPTISAPEEAASADRPSTDQSDPGHLAANHQFATVTAAADPNPSETAAASTNSQGVAGAPPPTAAPTGQRPADPTAKASGDSPNSARPQANRPAPSRTGAAPRRTPWSARRSKAPQPAPAVPQQPTPISVGENLDTPPPPVPPVTAVPLREDNTAPDAAVQVAAPATAPPPEYPHDRPHTQSDAADQAAVTDPRTSRRWE